MKDQKIIHDLNFYIPQNKILKFCERWKVTELSLFGSAVREDFNAEKSDIDLLISFSNKAEWSLLDQVEMQEELKQMFGRDVDLISREAVEKSKNWLRRNAILSNTRTIYAA